MRRFLLRENIKRFREYLAHDVSAGQRRYLLQQLHAMQRELALMDAATLGAQRYPVEFGRLSSADRGVFQRHMEASAKPVMTIDPRAGLHILDVNDAHTEATFTERSKVAGERLFDVFPDNPDLQDASGVSNLFRSIYLASQTRRPHVMQAQRYDLRGPDGRFLTRYWQTVSIPILNEDERLVCILHQAEDVTSEHVGKALAASAALGPR